MPKTPTNKPHLITVIIPAYQQEKTIAKDLHRIQKVLSQSPYHFEVIVVVDGIVDNTFKNAKKVSSKYNVKVYGYDNNRGKGYAVRFGMMRSKGDIVGFIDSGMDLNPNGIAMLLEHFQWYKADIIIGSKRHPVSKVQYPFSRKIISYSSQIFIRSLFGLNVRDTQVGLKFFRRKVLEDVLPRLLVKQFAFDIEILAVAYYLGYRKIYEAPVELKFNPRTSGISHKLFYSLWKTFWDTLAIFYRLIILRYYDDSSKRKWKFDPELNFRVNVG